MGMLIEGRWTEEDRQIEAGAYVRPAAAWAGPITTETITLLPGERDRFHLIASLSCPWSHRTLLTRTLKELEEIIPVQIAGGPRLQGYAANGSRPWRVPGTDVEILHVHQLYALSSPGYTGRVSVPILWDAVGRRIVSNESARIIRALDAVPAKQGQLDFTLAPAGRLDEIERMNDRIYHGLSNGVYRAGFATNQTAYDEAVATVFATLDELEARLADRRYLMGALVSEADWRLFPTLARFDTVYYTLSRCTRRRLVDYPNLWAYARDLYAWRGVADTTDFDAIREGAYTNDLDNNPLGIIAVASDVDWKAPHERERLGHAQVALRSGELVEVEPATLRRLRA